MAILAKDRLNDGQIFFPAGSPHRIFGSRHQRDDTLGFLQRRILVAQHSISLGQDCRIDEVAFWLTFAGWLERIARLFRINFCPGTIATNALVESQAKLSKALVAFRLKVELSQPGLQASNGLSSISVKHELGE